MEQLLSTLKILALIPILIPFAIVVKLFPVLHSIYFPYLWKKIGVKPSHKEAKKVIFSDLKDIKPRDSSTSVRVLELGIGHGANFDYYPPNSTLTALDINEKCKPLLLDTLKAYPNVRLERFLTTTVEDLSMIESESIDVVICILTLCGNNLDHVKVLNEVKRVLVKGGKFYFMEHIKASDDSHRNLCQLLLEPFWSILVGCTLRSDFGLKLSQADFSDVTSQFKLMEDLPLVVKAHIYGSATK